MSGFTASLLLINGISVALSVVLSAEARHLSTKYEKLLTNIGNGRQIRKRSVRKIVVFYVAVTVIVSIVTVLFSLRSELLPL